MGWFHFQLIDDEIYIICFLFLIFVWNQKKRSVKKYNDKV